ncbi:MAG TPA: EamA family transporter [Terriglobales bacterium]|nr:EamA family transporter [Terriglobales bacterium]
MQFFIWLGLCLVVVMSWGVLGVFEKLASDELSPARALVWVAIGFLILQASIAFPHAFWRYPLSSLTWGLVNGLLTAVGFLALLSAMRHGGKASIVEPLSALYPVLVAFLAPRFFGERASLQHTMGVVCAFVAAVLFTLERSEEVNSARP